MIPITKEEKARLIAAFPPNRPPYYTFPRTMRQDSARHHYYCPESEELMRLIADTNGEAARLAAEFDRRNGARKAIRRGPREGGGANGG